MSAVATRVTITRTLLALSNLTSTNAESDPFLFGEITGAGIQWNRTTVASPWVHGRRLRAATKSPAQLTGEFHIMSAADAHPDAHDAALAVLLDALAQFTYTLTLTFDDGTAHLDRAFVCEPADVTPPDSHMISDSYRWTTVQATIPHHPIPSSGAW